MEYIGFLLGKKIKKLFLDKWIWEKIGNFDIQAVGVENLAKLKGKAYILAANHLKPHNFGLLKTGIAPDSFVIRKVIREKTGGEIAIVINYALGIPSFNRLFEGFTKGFIRGLGSIPVGKNRGRESFRKVFLKNVSGIVSEKRPILIHPVGAYYEDFEKSHEIKAGTAYIALKYKLSIVAVYIKGANDWNKKNQKVYLSFGKPFRPDGLTIDKISEKIKEEILRLKSSFAILMKHGAVVKR